MADSPGDFMELLCLTQILPSRRSKGTFTGPSAPVQEQDISKLETRVRSVLAGESPLCAPFMIVILP